MYVFSSRCLCALNQRETGPPNPWPKPWKSAVFGTSASSRTVTGLTFFITLYEVKIVLGYNILDWGNEDVHYCLLKGKCLAEAQLNFVNECKYWDWEENMCKLLVI